MIRVMEADQARELLQKRNPGENRELEERVSGIVAAVRKDGDSSLCRFSMELDGYPLATGRIRVSEEEIESACREVDRGFLRAVREARDNIRSYHEKQLVNSWFDSSREGVLLGQMIRPLDRVGIYVPGGKASYPSSVLMNAIPARVAGVGEIAMVTPPGRDGRVDIHTLAAASETGVTEIYRVGGAQAIAALAYGTESIRAVDKITGPGNRYVTAAKRMVFGVVGIDMLAGPSEILVVADSSANPVYVAADLLSQAEHDEMAAVLLITPDRSLAESVRTELESQLALLGRSGIAARALSDYGAIVITGCIEEALELANSFAPEHLELMVSDPFNYLGRVKAAGAVFLGQYSPEPLGDYLAGPNHVLPTGGTARFFSPLGVDQFIRRTSVISYSRKAFEREAGSILKLAGVEGLDAHARSVSVRMERGEGPSKAKAGYDKGDEVGRDRFDIIQKGSLANDPYLEGKGELSRLQGLPGMPDRNSPGLLRIPDLSRPDGGKGEQ